MPNFFRRPKFGSKKKPDALRLTTIGLTALCGLVALGCGGGRFGADTPLSVGFVYVTNSASNDISMFATDDSGQLSFLGKTPCGKTPVALQVSGDYVFVANIGDNTVQSFFINNDGSLTAKSTVATGNHPNALQADHGVGGFGNNILDVVCSGSNQLIRYNIGKDGVLTQDTTVATGNDPVGVTNVDLTAYVTNFNDNTISAYNTPLPGKPGAITPQTPATYATGNGPTQIGFFDFGFLYEINSADNTISAFNIREKVATKVGTYPTGRFPIAMTFTFPEQSLRQVLTLNRTDETVTQFAFNQDTGVLTPSSTTLPAGPKPTALASCVFNMTTLAGVCDENGNVLTYIKNPAGNYQAEGTYADRGTTPSAIGMTGEFAPDWPAIGLPASVPNGKVGAAYTANLPITGGNGRQFATWRVDTLPPGLALVSDPTTGAEKLTGTPTLAGTYMVDLEADQAGKGNDKVYTITIDNSVPFSITTASLPDGAIGTAYSAPLAVSGGVGGAITWSADKGQVPAGLDFHVSGGSEVLSGTPTAGGSITFEVKAVQGGNVATKLFTFFITGGTSSGAVVTFMNGSTSPSDTSLTLKIGAQTFPNVAAGAVSNTVGLVDTGGAASASIPWSVSNSSAVNWTPGNITLYATDRNVLVGLGSQDSERAVSSFHYPSSFPGTTQAGILVMDGIPATDVPSSDVYLLDSTNAVVASKTGVLAGQFAQFAVAPGSYKVRVTFGGQPTSEIATSNSETVTVGNTTLNVLVSPPNISAVFYTAKG